MPTSPRWSALVVVVAILYASKDHLQLAKHNADESPPGTGTMASDLEQRVLATGFFQASSISIRPVTGAEALGTHAVTFAIDDLAPLAAFTLSPITGMVHFMASTLKFFQDWAEMAGIVKVRMATEPDVADSISPDHRFVHGTLAYMTADANRLAGNISALAHEIPLPTLLGAASNLMITMAGCKATAVGDIVDVTIDDTKLQLQVRVVDNPHMVSEFDLHPKQRLSGPGNHYHFFTAPDVVHDAKSLMEYTQSPAAAGAAVGIFLKLKVGSPPPPSPPPPPPPAAPATYTVATILAPGAATVPLFVGCSLQLTVNVITNGLVTLKFRTNGILAPNSAAATVPAAMGYGGSAEAAAAVDGFTGDEGTAGAAAGDVALTPAATGTGSDDVAAQGGNVIANWWLFPPFGPRFRTTPILYNPNPLVVSASGTYTLSVFFQRAGIFRIDAVNARNQRLVTQRALVVRVMNRAPGQTC